MSKNMQMNLSQNLLVKALENIITSPHSKLIAKVIVENIATTEVGGTQIFMALMGIEDTTKWVIGDQCLVDVESIHSWNIDKSRTLSEKIGMSKGRFIATIIDIKMVKRDNIKVGIEGYVNGEITRIEQWVQADNLHYDVDLPLNGPRDISDIL